MSETSLTHMYFFILHLKLKNKKKREEKFYKLTKQSSTDHKLDNC